MSDAGQLRIHPRRDDVAARLADDVVELLATRLHGGGEPRIVLTGGSVAREVHRELAARGAGLDWSRVTVLWGDERFLPGSDPERNARQAQEDLLSHLPLLPSRVLPVPAADEAPDVHAAATAYSSTVASLTAGDAPRAPAFDLVMLGIGDDAHVASLFPGRAQPPGLVVAVTDSPKPPPQRVSMSFELLGRARQVWFVAAGSEKAGAVATSVRGQPADRPAARVRGAEGTRWYLDRAAAAQLSSGQISSGQLS